MSSMPVTLDNLMFDFHLRVRDFTFTRKQLPMSIKLGNFITGLFCLLAKDINVMINTLLRPKVIGQRFEGSIKHSDSTRWVTYS